MQTVNFHKIKLRPHPLLAVLLAICLWTSISQAQEAAPGQWLVQFQPGANIGAFAEQLERRLNQNLTGQEYSAAPPGKPVFSAVAPSMNLWLIRTETDKNQVLPWLKQQPEIAIAQRNHFLQLRGSVWPDDPAVGLQWHLSNDGSGGGLTNADIDADLAWNYTTGGLTMAGDTIVVAVIDGGVSKTHVDLKQNMWVNYGEKPSDGVDNDANGYIDDFYGWNVFSENDNIQGINTTHGTPVCGVIGAAGNNGTGVAGVNWNVRMMFVAGGNLESEILAAYDYVLQARKSYNASNGAKGAFVVAINCSWGMDHGTPEDSPIWCAAFDLLGEAGILSVAATANNPEDVELVGDLPTTCPSNYLISVTSLDKYDQKAPDAAWGSFSIDLGAYGEDIYSTKTGNLYGSCSGTSFAAPQVAGAIGLLYAAPCPELIGLTKSNPAAGALWAKNILLNSVIPNQSLQGRTLTNGRLNLFSALDNYQVQCAQCPSPFALFANTPGPFTAQLRWSQLQGQQAVTLRWRKKGSQFWTIQENVNSPFELEALTACTVYECGLRARCTGGEWSEWSNTYEFTTAGCCEAPTFHYQLSVINGGVDISWDDLYGFGIYRVLIRPADSSDWHPYYTNDTTFDVLGLQACQPYEVNIEGWCLNNWVSLTPLLTFTTKGCGACLEKNYCPINVSDTQEEWINSVQIGTWSFDSGWGGGGYQNFAGSLSTPALQLPPNTELDVAITPGFWATNYKEYYRIYIDFNQDGDFDDADELAFDPGYALEGVAYGKLHTPEFSGTGNTRMRVIMKYVENGQIPPESCQSFEYGQVEDYCAEMIAYQSDAKPLPDSLLELKVYPQPAGDWAYIDLSRLPDQEYRLRVWDISGRRIRQETLVSLRGKLAWLDTSEWSPGIYLLGLDSGKRMYRGKLVRH